MSGSTGLAAGDKVLITGGAGRIGSAVAAACLNADLVPVFLDDLSTGLPERTEGRIFYQGDIADSALLDRIFADHPGIAAAVHCAALTTVPESVANPIRYHRESVTKTLELIEGLVRNGCRRLVFSSSASGHTKAITEWLLENVERAGDLRAVAVHYSDPIDPDPLAEAHVAALLDFDAIVADHESGAEPGAGRAAGRSAELNPEPYAVLNLGAAAPGRPIGPFPVVDVLMPYYGNVAMMREAVRSVLAQRDPHWRLSVVDDGAEPGVPEWFAGLIAEHGPDKIHYQRNATTLGVTENFQKCLSLVTQPLVTMIGSDDRMLPDYIGTVRALMRDHPQASLAQPGVEVIDANGEVVEPWVDKVKRRVYAPRVHGAAVLGGESLAVSLLRGNWMYFPAICWRADVITEIGFNPDLRVVQDLALTLEQVRAGARIVVSDTVCFQYRRHAAGVSSERAFSGARLAEERDFFLGEAAKMERLGWRRAARAARMHLSSRLHAATLLPGAVRRGSREGVRTLAAYAFGPTRRADGGTAGGAAR